MNTFWVFSLSSESEDTKKKIILNVSVWLNIMNDTHRYVMKKELGIPFFSSVAFQILLNQLCISCASSSNKFIYLLILESVQLLYQLIWRELVATLSSFQLPLPRWDHSSEMEYPHQLLELLCWVTVPKIWSYFESQTWYYKKSNIIHQLSK